MPNVIFEYEDRDGKLRSFAKNDLCLRLMGKGVERMKGLRSQFRDGNPLTATFEQMFNTVSESNVEAAKAVFAELLKLSQAFRCVLTTPDCVEPDGDCMVTLHHPSYNEVMFALFHIRSLFHYDEQAYSVVPGTPEGRERGKPVFLKIYESMQAGWSFPSAYVACMWTRSSGRVSEYHLPCNDGSCFRYNLVSAKRLYQWAKGELYGELEFQQLSLTEHFARGKGYFENIQALMEAPTSGSDNAFGFYTELYTAYKAGGEVVTKKDLFGNTFITQASGSGSPQTWEEYKSVAEPIFKRYMGEF